MSEKLISLENLSQYHKALMKSMVVTAKKDEVPYYWKVGHLDEVKELVEKYAADKGVDIYYELECTDEKGNPNRFYSNPTWFNDYNGYSATTNVDDQTKALFDELNKVIIDKFGGSIPTSFTTLLFIPGYKIIYSNAKEKIDYSPIYDKIITLDNTFDNILNLHKKGTPIELHYSEIKSNKEDSIYQSTVMPLNKVDLSVKSGNGGITFKNSIGDCVVVYSDGTIESSLFKN